MSGNARDADNVIPKLSDDGEDAESTIAMETPGFTSDGPPPLPVSEPPPAMGAATRPAAGAPVAASAVQKVVDPGRVSASTQKAPVAMPPRPNLAVGRVTPPPPSASQDRPVPSSANAVTVPKPKVVDLGVATGIPNLDDGPRDPDDVETKAVSREAMLAAEPHFVVRGEEEAGGDDATVALPPSENKGAVAANIAAAIGETLKSRIDSDGLAAGTPGFPAAGRPAAWGPEPTPFPSSNPMQAGAPTQGAPVQGVGTSPMAHPVGRPLSGAMPVNPLGQQAHPGMPMHPHVIAPAMSGAMGYANPNAPTAPVLPTQAHGPQGWAGGPSHVPAPGYAPLQPPGDVGRARQAPPRFSGQVIVLIAVGVVCITIFITGVVLFVTTKF